MSTDTPGDQISQEAVTAILNSPFDRDTRIKSLLPVVYGQLRATAQSALQNERRDHTLQATALVHEVYLRLVGEREVPWENRAHFYHAAAEAMRRILIDHARARGRLKRGGGRKRENFADVIELAKADPDIIEALDASITKLEAESPEAAAVVRLRFYAGLGIDQTALALNISPRQVNRVWTFARAWLFRSLESP